MNLRQEVAAWVFGVLVALWLLLSDHALWAFVVLAGLTILSLRDRLKKKARSVVSETPLTPEPTTPLSEQPLRSLTPHLLAAALLLDLRAKGEPPFQMWRSPHQPIPPEADALFELTCQNYQLWIFLGFLERRFGTPIAKLVEANFVSVLANVRLLPDLFSIVNTAVLRARALAPAQEGLEDARLRIDRQVTDEALGFVQQLSEEDKKAWRLPLAVCVSLARVSAERVFPGLVAKIKFDPLSIADVPLETAHKGITNRWREVPGCFERHLQRKEGNPLFPVSERQPSDDAIERARAKDVADLEKARTQVNALLQSGVESLKRMTTVGEIADFQKTQVIALLRSVAGLGESGLGLFKTLEKCRDHLHKAIADAVGGEEGQKLLRSCEELEKRFQFQYNLLFAQMSREDTPIPDLYLPSLLSESFDTIKEFLEGLYSSDPEDAKTLAKEGVVMLNEVAQQGFELNGAEGKLRLLEEYAKKTDPLSIQTAT